MHFGPFSSSLKFQVLGPCHTHGETEETIGFFSFSFYVFLCLPLGDYSTRAFAHLPHDVAILLFTFRYSAPHELARKRAA